MTARLAEVLREIPRGDEIHVLSASLHTMRHTSASHLVMNSVDLYTVQKVLGHSSIKTTEIYAHSLVRASGFNGRPAPGTD